MNRPSVPVLLLFSAIVFGAMADTVAADPPGPTDYLTEIVSIEPEPGSVADITVEGGDAFIQLQLADGHTAMVYGYDGEPYLRFDADGSVHANQRSPSLYYNDERFGGDVPEHADATAAPEWVEVADDGVYAWHDHRAHWMSEQPLAGLAPGDALPHQTIELSVDDVPTAVVVETTLQAEPSSVPLMIGAIVGLGIAAALWSARWRGLAAVLATSSVAAVGIGQYFAEPSSTGPAWSWIALPSVAVMVAVAAATLPARHFARPVLWFGVGLILVLWVYRRAAVATAAYVPNALGGSVDRAVSAAALVVGLTLVGISVWLFSAPTSRSPRRSLH